jgi:hypothetical protein
VVQEAVHLVQHRLQQHAVGPVRAAPPHAVARALQSINHQLNRELQKSIGILTCSVLCQIFAAAPKLLIKTSNVSIILLQTLRIDNKILD